MRSLGSGAIASGICVLAGPFGTFETMTLLERAVYWPLVIFVSLVIALGVRPVLLALVPSIGATSEVVTVALIFTILYTPLLYAITIWFADANAGTVMHPVAMGLVVLSVPIIAHTLRMMFNALPNDGAAGAQEGVRARILRRLGEDAHTIYRMSMRDHYVEIHTNLGISSLLMRFSDALDEVEGLDGLRVHRSHWVSCDAVSEVVQDGARVFLDLNCGTRVPVSRSYRDQVMSAGLPGTTEG